MKRTLNSFLLVVSVLSILSSTCSSTIPTGKAADMTLEGVHENQLSRQDKGDEGIRFEKMNLAEAKKKAKESGKYIFIDAYTSWCGPCKQMAATTFKDEEVATYFNDKFINLKIEMEKDADGAEVARMYNVRAYPTLIIIDHTGKLVQQTIGFQTKDRLLEFGKAAK